MSKIKPTILIIALIIIIFILTKNPLTSVYKLQMTLVSLLALISYIYIIKKQGRKINQTKTFYLISTFILFLVASTGWFYSPFFFALYLLSIFLSFVFIPSTAMGFVITLAILFSFNIGENSLAYDFLVVLSLLTVIPLTFYLKKEYLRLKEAQKEILIMRKEEKEYKNKVEEVLANKINEISVNLRQPINDIKQILFMLKKQHNQHEIEKQIERIHISAEEALSHLNKFEQETTGKKLLTTPNKFI